MCIKCDEIKKEINTMYYENGKFFYLLIMNGLEKKVEYSVLASIYG